MIDILQLSEETLTVIIFLVILAVVIKWAFIYLIIKTATKNAILDARAEIRKTPESEKLTPQEILDREINGWK